MMKTNGIQVVSRGFSVGRGFKYILSLVLLVLLLSYCWNRVQRLTGGSGNAGAVGQHINNGSANSNSGTASSQIDVAANKNGVSAASLNNSVRSYSGIPGHGRYQKNLVALNESSVLGEHDELLRLSTFCQYELQRLGGSKRSWDSRREAYLANAPDKISIVWDAQAPARAAAQLAESCQFFNSPPLQDSQRYSRDSILRRSAYTNLLKATATSEGVQSRAGQDAVQVMIREGSYGSLKALLSTNLRFDGAYVNASFALSQLAPVSLDPFMLDLTLCRLGDDCGEGSITANQICAQAAICGGSAEDAILRHVYQLGYDVNQINKRINEIVARLQAGNFEDLKPQESTEQKLRRILKSLGFDFDKGTK